MNAPVASASRSVARAAIRSTKKSLVNDSMAFHPSQRLVASSKQTSDAFAFYPSHGASARIPKPQSQTPPVRNSKLAEQPVSKYSAAELDQIFSKSRLHATTTTNSTSAQTNTTIAKDSSFAFYPSRQSRGVTANTTTKETSFGFYPSQGVAQRRTMGLKPKAQQQQQQQQQQQAKPEGDNASLVAMGSLMMGFLGVQARRSVARA